MTKIYLLSCVRVAYIRIPGVDMKSTKVLKSLCAIILAALVLAVIPASAATVGGVNTSEFLKGYPGISPDTRSSAIIEDLKSNTSQQFPLQSATKSQIIESLKNQSTLPPAQDPGSLPTPTPAPDQGYFYLELSKYTDGRSKESLITRYLSEKSAELNPPPDRTDPRDPPSVSDSSERVVEANNQFAIDLYQQLVTEQDQRDKNIFFSPWSISSALAITYEGARGTTAEEIRSVFHFPADAAVRRTGFSELASGLNRGGTGYALHTANALWAEQSYPFLPSYITTAANSYSAYVTNLDFINNPEPSRQTINQWVADRTEDKIQDLLPEGSIHPLIRLVITNAIYFKGSWDKQFSEENTVEEDFRVSASQTVRIPMMRRTDGNAKYWYTETDTLQVLGMPYAHKDGNELSMLVILPKDDNLAAAEQALTAGKVSDLQQALAYRQVKVYFPKFRLETDYRLSGTLREMGMPTAFGYGDTDFSGMDGTKALFIDNVFHKAYVDVNEQGTEAAAATATTMMMGMEISYEPIPVFRADHPFIFLIQDSDTGNILFMGRVVNPNG